MFDIVEESIKGYNLPFTIFLTIIVCYWVVVLTGLGAWFGGEDGEAEVDGAETGGSSSFMTILFRVVGASDVPLVFILSLFGLLLWGTNMIANILFNTTGSSALAGLLLIPVVILSMLGTRILVRPLRPLMNFLKESEPTAPIIGEQGIVKSASLDQKFGRVEILFDGKPLLLNAVISGEGPPLKKGTPVLLVSKQDNSDIYIVRALGLEV